MVYFPIVWSAYNPQSIQLVETFLRQQKHQPNFTLDEFSEHRGKWLPHGTGMYVMRGSDARSFRFDTTFQGWGGEDKAFFFLIWQHRRLLRRHETGLVHVWHDKSCVMGKDVFTETQMKSCESVRKQLQGSELGRKVLESKSEKRSAKNADVTTRSTTVVAVRDEVHCGGHSALSCADCSQGHGAFWCNGDCWWSSENGGVCKSLSENHSSAELQLDIMVPVFQKDDRLRVFAADLGKAIVDYKQNVNNDGTPQISAFRLLVTRYSSDETSQPNSTADFQSELAALAFLPKNGIVMVHAPSGQNFSRSAARNLLHDNACPLDTCLATAMDVDMEIRQEFFQHAVQGVVLMQDEENESKDVQKLSKQQIDRQKMLHKNTSVPMVYFPIVWSAYNPQSIQLVETFLRQEKHQPNFTLDEFSEHSGCWRPYGFGMYVMRGSDIRSFRFDTTFRGWGGEDKAFFMMIWQHRRLMRRHETGLIHVWHDKSCVMGKDVFTQWQMKTCRGSRRRVQGSKLGNRLERMSVPRKVPQT
jgi:hypothetical protein